MIDYHRFCQIKDLHARQGLNASQISRRKSRWIAARWPTG